MYTTLQLQIVGSGSDDMFRSLPAKIIFNEWHEQESRSRTGPLEGLRIVGEVITSIFVD